MMKCVLRVGDRVVPDGDVWRLATDKEWCADPVRGVVEANDEKRGLVVRVIPTSLLDKFIDRKKKHWKRKFATERKCV